MSEHTTIQLAYEGIQAMNRHLGGANQHPYQTLADTEPSQQFEFDLDGLEGHEGNLFFYEFDMEEESRRMEMMKELELRRVWAQHHQPSDEDEEDGEGEEGEEEEEEETYTSSECANGSHQVDQDGRPAPWGGFDWRIGIAEYILEYGQEAEPLSPERAAQVDQALFQTFPGIRKYYEEHPEEYSASLNEDLGNED